MKIRLPTVLVVSGVLGVVALVAGCAPFSSDTPPVTDSTMVALLVDLHLANARAELSEQATPDVQDSVLAAHGLDSTTYSAAVDYYAAHADQYSDVYARVLDVLNDLRRAPEAGEVPATQRPIRGPSQDSIGRGGHAPSL